MPTAPIARPALYQTPGAPFPTQRAQLGDSSNTIPANSFVKISGGVLAAYVADDTAIAGLQVDASTTSTTEPYASPFGENHNILQLRGQRFLMNITDGSGTVGSGNTTVADVTVGTLYSARYLATVDTSCLAIDASDSGTAGKNIFRVVSKYDTATVGALGDATTTSNGRCVVEVIDSAIQ